MKKKLSVVIMALAVSVPTFASDLIGHTAKDAGKGAYKGAVISAKAADKAVKSTAKFLF